ncbi:hypothetical protein A3K63_04885 [Candidatus Micrarchaeota archaeon RBG_16_49_10]|nr:MAG: hypothetical protein A3K63_04885 [Candidatus Micrarchaeota archaeon RBG_16_49_10]
MVITGKIIREMRKEAELSQKRLAELVGVTQAHIAKIENERVNPRLSTVNRIMAVLSRSSIVPCRKVMKRKIISLKPEDSLIDAANLMRSAEISQIPIMDKGLCVGSITDKGLIRQLGGSMRKMRVREMMERPFPIIPADDSVEIAKGLLEHYQAVLVSERGKIAGIITKSDLLALMK